MVKTPESDAAKRDRFRDLSADQTLTAIDQSKTASRRAEVDLLALAAHWADLHGHLDPASSPALPGSEQLICFGGDGTPAVAEFAPAELAAVLGVSAQSAIALIADALDLRHRLPLLWPHVCAHEVTPWIARKIAEKARGLSRDAAQIVDARVAPWADRLTWGRLEKVVDAAVIAADPTQAEQDAANAEANEGVWLSDQTCNGLRDVHIRTDAASAIEFDSAVDQVASELAALGDSDPRTVRRAKAVGVLAHPQQALDLLSGPADHADCDRPKATRQSATVYLHMTADDWRAGEGVARAEGIGPITIGQAQRWLQHRNVLIKPLVDPAGVAPVDGYEIPDRMREAVHMLSPADAFPYASSTSRRTDLDHTTPYIPLDQGGPPGQTAIGNLAKLTRRHHRIKTFGRWQVKQPFPGVLIWRSPHGRTFVVDQTGTRRLSSTA